MDRQFVYAGAIPLDTDLLSTNINAYIGLSKLAAAILGTNTIVNAATCSPTSPASMSVIVGPCEIYETAEIDTSSYGDLGTNANVILKQGINLNSTTISSITAPAIAGTSQNYLIEFSFQEQDGGSEVLAYYNSSDPTSPYSGPNNTGDPNFTVRQDQVVITVKAGTPAPTGTQTTPSPDANCVGVFVITVANGQTTIATNNITNYIANNPGTINETLTQKISQTTADQRYAQQTQVQSGQFIYAGASSGTNTYTCSLTNPALTSYTAGLVVSVKITIGNTSASSLNINSLGAKTIIRSDGTALQSGDLSSGQVAYFIYDGTNFQLLNYKGFALITNIQNGSYIYAGTDSGTANAYVGALSPALASYTAGLAISIKISNANTGASTINLNSLGAIGIIQSNGSALSANSLLSGQIAYMIYDGTHFQLVNNQSLASITNVQNGSYVYAVDAGSANTYTANLSPAIGSYTAGLRVGILISNSNTGSSTLNLNSLGAKNIKRVDGTNPHSGDLISGGISLLEFDGTNFQLLNPACNQISVNEFFITSSQTYTPSANLISARVRAVGGGGGGAGCGSSNTTVGAGTPAGAGGYAEALFSASQIGSSVSITIGAAGVGGAALSSGSSGGQTLFGSLLTCNGGVHGVAQNSSAGTAGGNGGAGGAASGGTINVTGQSGGFAAADNNSINLGWLTAGGNSMMGLGGQGGFATSGGTIGGQNATGYGAGGGGSISINTGSSASSGGNGSPGCVHIIEYCLTN